MTMAELHPDELLSREASSTLTAREWADLSAHLARCPACALERAVGREAARARVPSNQDHAIAARVVGRLLAGQAESPARRGRLDGPVKFGATFGRRLAYGALALVLASGTAMAGVALVAQIRQRPTVVNDADSGRAPSRRPGQRRQRTALVGTAVAEGVQDGSPAPLPDSAPAAAAPVTRPTPLKATSPVSTVTTRSAAKAARSTPAVARHRAPPVPASPESPRGDATSLLGQAEAAESGGRLAEASQLYGELGRRFAGSREEIVARALYGQLLLDRLVNPARALALFEAYLKAEPAGTLAEEARLGRAQALQRLGRPSDERVALLELLRAHPRSVHASAARTRLAMLDRP